MFVSFMVSNLMMATMMFHPDTVGVSAFMTPPLLPRKTTNHLPLALLDSGSGSPTHYHHHRPQFRLTNNNNNHNRKMTTTTTTTTSTSSLSLSPQDIIETGVSIDTFAPQFLWLPMIVAPRSKFTTQLMGSLVPILLLSMVHLTIVAVAAGQEGATSQIAIFGEVFDPALSQLGGMTKMFQFPNFVAEEWPHVLVWDLFVGRLIWLDGIERSIDTRIALLFCNGIGPPGLLIHAATCLFTGKGLPPMGYNPPPKEDDTKEG